MKKPNGYWKQYYSDPEVKTRHQEAVRKNQAKRKQSIKEWTNAYKMEHGCEICGFKEHPLALDFAHIDRSTKVINISNAARNGWALQRVQSEIVKCKVLCANHHRLETAKENEGL